MARQFDQSYTSDPVVADDGSVAFACSQDEQAWQWLALGPHHPVVVQTQNFWASVGAMLALGGMEDGQWSALTWTDWTCGERPVGRAVRGLYRRERDGDDETYRIELFDAHDRLIAAMRGRGVVFRNRDFEGWRSKAKAETLANAGQSQGFEFAPRAALGIGPGEHPLVGPIERSEEISIPALVTAENGLPPANRVLDGSGDHVNSVHMIEAARQALCLLRGNPAVDIVGGEMALTRYVELDAAWRLKLVEDAKAETRWTIKQAGRDCARITLREAAS